MGGSQSAAGTSWVSAVPRHGRGGAEKPPPGLCGTGEPASV